ncbi:cholesterol 7-desaturase nvd-like [Centruroides vittatus]|uniref:cholesterol 7-desaturase nvd-like n=1 Tax=Centruroides vittatus TaxID=120091 RepID=UPI003510788C
MYFSLSTYNRVVDMTDIGYEDGRMNAKELRRKRMQLLKETNRLRRAKECLPVYPNGWIPLLESRDLPIGKCKPVTALGQQFVIFRGKTGTCFVLDAYCPHLGAHLGTDGKVHEDCIECPFHGWRFAGQDGSCVKIPYAEKIPEVAKIKSWKTIEQNGFIYVWHHAEGQPLLWKLPVIQEIENGRMLYKGRSEQIVNCHIQEIIENQADFTHFDSVHKFGISSKIILHPENWWRFVQTIINISSCPVCEERFYCYGTEGIVTIKLFGISALQVSFQLKQIGPAINHLDFKGIFGSGTVVLAYIPEGPFRQRIIQHYYFSSRFAAIFDYIFSFIETLSTERDVRVWNYKMYLKNPVYMSEDKTIAKFRKWYSQFYSENSPKLDDQNLNW